MVLLVPASESEGGLVKDADSKAKAPEPLNQNCWVQGCLPSFPADSKTHSGLRTIAFGVNNPVNTG